ncbi:MAG TPA: hypothetical protein VFQ24_12730 [Terriglobia bacterium]|nr:hypothetical protein [Terriglobia bacterium]
MCDYSLMGVPNRLAKAGEELVLYRFHTGTLGFTSLLEATERQCPRSFWHRLTRSSFSPGAAVPAVCIPPGARLRLEDVPNSLQLRLEVGQKEEVTFTQLSVEPHRHRDAVRFDNGRTSRIQDLRPGMRAKVLDLSRGSDSEPGMDDSLEFLEVFLRS